MSKFTGGVWFKGRYYPPILGGDGSDDKQEPARPERLNLDSVDRMALQDVNKELEHRANYGAWLFEKGGPGLTLTREEAQEIQTLNKETGVLGDRRDILLSAQKAADSFKRYQDDRTPVRTAHHPTHTQKTDDSDNPDRGPLMNKDGSPKSLGDLFVESGILGTYRPAIRKSEEVEIDLGPLMSRKTLFDTATGYVPETMRIGRIEEYPVRRPIVADMIPQGTTEQTAIVYMEETTFTNNAAFVAEGGTKPESALAFTERSAPVRKIATVLPVTQELLEDVPAMRAYLESRLRLFLTLREETALISGTGTPPEFFGMLNTSGIQTQAVGADPVPDAIYKAMMKIMVNAFLDPTGIIMHPLDWQDIRLLRTADGIYIWGNPSEPGLPRIWGLPVTPTVAMTQNTAIVAAFDASMMIFRRTGVSFAISDQHSDFFITNKLMLRVEERLAFPVFRPAGICTVTGV